MGTVFFYHGPPDIKMFVDILEALYNSEIGERNKTNISNMSSELGKLDLMQAIDEVPHCLLKPAYQDSVVKLSVHIRNDQWRRQFNSAMTQLNACKYHGAKAPAGPLEDISSKWVQALESA